MHRPPRPVWCPPVHGWPSRPQNNQDPVIFPVSLIALVVTMVLAALLMARLGSHPGPTSANPTNPAQTSPAQTTQAVQRAADAAAQGDRQRLDDAMKVLR